MNIEDRSREEAYKEHKQTLMKSFEAWMADIQPSNKLKIAPLETAAAFAFIIDTLANIMANLTQADANFTFIEEQLSVKCIERQKSWDC